MPSGWEEVSLGKVATVTMGQSPPGSSYNDDGVGLPLIQGNADIEGRRTIQRLWTTEPTKRCRAGDVVLTVRAPVGYTALASEDSCLGRGVCSLAAGDDNGYLFHALTLAERRWGLYAQGSTFTAVNADMIREFSIPWSADRGERGATASALDDADELVAVLARAVAKSEAVKEGMMQRLLGGTIHTAGFGGPRCEARLDQVALVDPESLSAGADPGTELDYISLEDVERGELLGHVRVPLRSAPSRARRVLRAMDVLFGTVRPNLQSHTLYEGGLARPIASTGFAVIRAVPGKADPRYLLYLLMSRLTTVQVERIIAGSNYPAVSSRDVRGLTFDFPTLAEQQAIGSALADCDAEISVLRARLAKARAVKQGMLQELLTGRTRLSAAEAAA